MFRSFARLRAPRALEGLAEFYGARRDNRAKGARDGQGPVPRSEPKANEGSARDGQGPVPRSEPKANEGSARDGQGPVPRSEPKANEGSIGMATFQSAAELKAAVGKHLGYSDWLQIDQQRIDRFAEATGDHQWIHVDPERAKSGPFGATIAHGYLTLSITNKFLPQLVSVPAAKLGINYGTNKVRFPAPVKVGSRVRCGAELLEASDVPGGVQVIVRISVEVEGSDKPACVVESITRYVFE
jgi:acyl dehydratase